MSQDDKAAAVKADAKEEASSTKTSEPAAAAGAAESPADDAAPAAAAAAGDAAADEAPTKASSEAAATGNGKAAAAAATAAVEEDADPASSKAEKAAEGGGSGSGGDDDSKPAASGSGEGANAAAAAAPAAAEASSDSKPAAAATAAAAAAEPSKPEAAPPKAPAAKGGSGGDGGSGSGGGGGGGAEQEAEPEGDGDAAATDAVANLSVSAGAAGDVPSGGQQVVAKLLISNAAAGSVIGKAGQTIEQIQKNSGARVQLSRAGEFYPGTSERVLLLSGSLHSVLTAVFLSLEKLPREPGSPTAAAGGAGGAAAANVARAKDDAVKLAVSRKLCGAVIGQKGQTIRDFMADSGATIRVQPLSELTPSDSERVITVAGNRDRVLRAVALILNTLSADDKFGAYMDLTLQLASTQGLIPAVRASARASTLAGARAVLTMALLDEDVGAILGKRGQTLTQIQQNAKVAIKISDRSKMDPTTHEREVTLSGSYGGIQLACAMISEKLAANRPRASDGGGAEEDLLDEAGAFY